MMSRYDLYLLVHIAAAAIWAGGGFMLLLLARRAEKSGDDAKLQEWLDESGDVVDKAFIPASLLVAIMGFLMIVDGSRSFESLWIALGIVGYLATFIIGVLVMEPWAKRIEKVIERDGHFSAEAAVQTRKFLMLARVDTLVVFLVIADMVLKPTADDVPVLAAMATVLLAGVALVLTRLRAIGSDAYVAPELR